MERSPLGFEEAVRHAFSTPLLQRCVIESR